MFELLNQEIKEFRAKYNKNCEIIIGKETLKKLLEFHSDDRFGKETWVKSIYHKILE